MTPDDRKAFAAAMTLLTEVLGGSGLSEPALDIYWRALSDLLWPDVQRACERAALQCRFFPKPVELRNLAAGLPVEGVPARLEDEDRTERAWLAWREAARRIGAYRSLLCEDGALGATLEAVFGGWPQACTLEASPEMWASTRKAFGRAYRACADQASQPRYLLGLHERDNRDKGLNQPADVGVLEVGGGIRQASLSPGQSPLALLSGDRPRALPAREEPIGMDEARSLWQRVRSAVQVRARGDAA